MKRAARLLMMLSIALLATGFASAAPLSAATGFGGIAESAQDARQSHRLLAGEMVPGDARGHIHGQAAGETAKKDGHGHVHGQETGEATPEDAADFAPAADSSASAGYSAREFVASLGLDEALLIVFFALFLLQIGVVMWWILSRGLTEEQNRYIGRHLLQLQRLTFLAVVANLLRFIWLHGGFDDLTAVLALPEDPEGLTWLVLFFLSAVGLISLHRSRFVDTLWLLAAVAAATQIGHADLSLDHVLSSFFSGIHQLAAALWIGGLYVLLAMRRRYRHDAERLAPNVANANIAAMVLLFVSGLVNSAMYLPDLSLIDKTRWGVILAGKTILFALLALFMIIVRRRRRNRLRGFLRLQFLAVFVLVAVSGMMPISEPVPYEGPLHWHVMGEDVHLTGEIDPLQIGENEYRVTVWFPEGTGEPRSVEMELRPEGRDLEARTVKLERREAETDLVFTGFAVYHYGATGGQIERSGTWTVVVRITDAAGKVWTFENETTVY